MNFDFGGSHKKLSLRGASQNATREDIVKRARLEREKSQLEKKQNQSATIIQNWFRAQSAKLKVKQMLREQFDAIIRAGKLSKQTCAELTSKLMLCYRESLDVNRLIILSRLLMRNFTNKDENTIFMRNIDMDTRRSGTASAFQVKHYLLHCVQYIDQLTENNLRGFEDKNVILSISAVLLFLDSNLFVNIDVYNDVCVYISEPLISVIRKILLLVRDDPEHKLTHHAMLLLNRLLGTQNEKVGSLLATQILTIPVIFDELLLKSVTKNVITLPQNFAAINLGIQNAKNLNYAQSFVDYKQAPPNLYLIGNLSSIAFELSKKNLIPANYMSALAKLLFQNKVLDYIHYSSIITKSKSLELYNQIGKLFTTVKNVDLNQIDFESICSVYWALLGNEEKRVELIHSLAYSSDFIGSVWLYLKNNKHLWRDQVLFIDKVLDLFAETYNSVLSTQDDDEFFTLQKPLPLTEVVELSGQLKDLVFQLYWSGTKDLQLRKNLTKLLTNIYNRNSRRRFCPENHFLLPSTFHIDFTVLTPQYTRTDAMEIDEEDELPMMDGFLATRRIEALKQAMENRPSNQDEENRVWNVLQEIPFVIPFNKRVKIFQHFVEIDRERSGGNWLPPVNVRRSHIFEDGYTHLYRLGRELKNDVRVQFISDQGHLEAGIGQGVFKEFIILLSNVAFSANYGLFLYNDEHELYPNPNSHVVNDNDLDHYKFLGQIIGKALYEKILVDIPFARFFLSKLLGKTNLINDLPSLDKSLHKNLMFLKNYAGDVEDLGLTFAVNFDEFGVQKTINLVTDGGDIPVDNNNKFSYIYRMAYYKLNSQIKKQSEAFVQGLSLIIPRIWLQMFDENELFKMICGTGESEDVFDVEDMRRNVVYIEPYYDQHPTIQMFWKVVSSFNPKQKRLLLKFITSSPRPPLLGFKDLDQKIGIRPTPSQEGLDKLPTSSTCVNLLKLPAYRNIDVLRDKLIQAIELGSEGFELT